MEVILVEVAKKKLKAIVPVLSSLLGTFSPCISPFELALQCTASFLQISGEKLGDAVNELFCNDKILEERRTAAKHAYHALSRGVVENVWRQLQFHIFNKSMRGMNVVEQRT